MDTSSPPPVPKRLREILADYPVLIERLQDVLVYSAARPNRETLNPFDSAVWMLEGQLEEFLMEARSARREAEASGNEASIFAAIEKEQLLRKAARKSQWDTDGELLKYFGNDLK